MIARFFHDDEGQGLGYFFSSASAWVKQILEASNDEIIKVVMLCDNKEALFIA